MTKDNPYDQELDDYDSADYEDYMLGPDVDGEDDEDELEYFEDDLTGEYFQSLIDHECWLGTSEAFYVQLSLDIIDIVYDNGGKISIWEAFKKIEGLPENSYKKELVCIALMANKHIDYLEAINNEMFVLTDSGVKVAKKDDDIFSRNINASKTSDDETPF